jgi:pectin methylesterase-like acyl-CoA thioesterase
VSILHVGTGPGDFAHIQDAVDAALNGDTIDIAAGTYREQVTVNGKDLTFHGAGDGAGGTIIGPERLIGLHPVPRTPS